MTRFGMAAAALTLGLAMSAGSGFVPATVGEAVAQTQQDRASKRAAVKRERAARRAGARSKRADCRAQAKRQKLGMIRTQRFIRACMKRA